MDIKKFKYFLTIVQTGSYSDAAAKLFISQAALSKHIISLEKELGVVLFDRSSRKIAITDQGRFLFEYAVKLTEDYERMMESLSAFNTKKLEIATMPIMVQYGITKLLSEFCSQNSSVDLSIIELNNDNIYFGLEHRNYELAFIRRDNIDMTKLDMIDIFKDQMVLIMSKQHTLSSKKSISLAEFKDDRFFFLNNETSLYDYSYTACVNAGFEPNIVFTGSRADNIAELVSSNLGVALLMRQIARSLNNNNINMVTIKEMPCSYISLVRLKRSFFSNAAQLLWNYVKENYRIYPF